MIISSETTRAQPKTSHHRTCGSPTATVPRTASVLRGDGFSAVAVMHIEVDDGHLAGRPGGLGLGRQGRRGGSGGGFG